MYHYCRVSATISTVIADEMRLVEFMVNNSLQFAQQGKSLKDSSLRIRLIGVTHRMGWLHTGKSRPRVLYGQLY